MTLDNSKALHDFKMVCTTALLFNLQDFTFMYIDMSESSIQGGTGQATKTLADTKEYTFTATAKMIH